MNKRFFVTLVMLFSFPLYAQVSCSFTIEQVNEQKAICKIKADKVKAVYVEVCGSTTCTGSDGETTTCATCSDEFSHFEKIGEYELDATIKSPKFINDHSKITLSYSTANQLESKIEQNQNVFYGLNTDSLIVENKNGREKVSGVIELESEDLTKDYELLKNSFSNLTYDRMSKEILMKINSKTDLKDFSFKLFYCRRAISQQNGDWYLDSIYNRELKPSDLYLREDGEGTFFATLNLKKITEQTNYHFREKRRYVILEIARKLPTFKIPIQTENYIKTKELKLRLIPKD